MPPPGVNKFYFYSFTLIDPLLSLSAVYMTLFAPHLFLDPGFARTSPLAKLNASHAFLMEQSAGAFAMFAFLMLFMLPQTDDLNVWRKFQMGLLCTDVAALYATWNVVQAQGGEWRSEALVNVGILGVIVVVRCAFVGGVGVGVEGGEGKATKKTA